jgi:hypothetical protein
MGFRLLKQKLVTDESLSFYIACKLFGAIDYNACQGLNFLVCDFNYINAAIYGAQPTEVSALRFEVLIKVIEASLEASYSNTIQRVSGLPVRASILFCLCN